MSCRFTCCRMSQKRRVYTQFRAGFTTVPKTLVLRCVGTCDLARVCMLAVGWGASVNAVARVRLGHNKHADDSWLVALRVSESMSRCSGCQRAVVPFMHPRIKKEATCAGCDKRCGLCIECFDTRFSTRDSDCPFSSLESSEDSDERLERLHYGYTAKDDARAFDYLNAENAENERRERYLSELPHDGVLCSNCSAFICRGCIPCQNCYSCDCGCYHSDSDPDSDSCNRNFDNTHNDHVMCMKCINKYM